MNRFPTIPAGALAVITHGSNAPMPDPELEPVPTPAPCTCRASRRRLGVDDWGWATLDGAWYGDDTTLVTDVRPLAVIDPASPADVDALGAAFDRAGRGDISHNELAAALEDYAAPNPPNPGEPATGGPYPDRAGAFWWRRNGVGGTWSCLDVPTREPLTWDALWDAYGPITGLPTGGDQ